MEKDWKVETDDLGRRLFENLNEVFDSLPSSVEEVGVILCDEEHKNKNPIHVESGQVGVEKWCIKHLFLYAYNTLLNDILKSEEDVMKPSRCVVLFCSDCTTAWNSRKHHLKHCTDVNVLTKELHLTKLAIRLHPKSTDSFAHRRWVLSRVFKDVLKSPTLKFYFAKCKKCNKMMPLHHIPATASTIVYNETHWMFIENELKVCTQAAEWHMSNYCAWSHRSWVMTSLVLHHLLLTGAEKSATFLLAEVDSVLKWVELNVSDHSGMSYCKEVLCLLTLTSFCFHEQACMCCSQYKDLQKSCTDLTLDIVLQKWLLVVTCCNDLLQLHCGTHEALWMFKYELIVSFHNFFSGVLEQNGEEHLKLSTLLSWQGSQKFCEDIEAKHFSALAKHCVTRHSELVRKFFEVTSQCC